MVDCFDDFAAGSEQVSMDGGAAGLFAFDVDGVELFSLDVAGGLCSLVEAGRAAGVLFASAAVCLGDAAGLCLLVEAGLAAGAVCCGDAGGLCSLDVGDVSEAGGPCSLDEDAAASSFSFSFTSMSRWMM